MLLDKVLKTINENNMLKAGDKVICALSGGADSMALLYALYELREKLGTELFAAHLNHSVRGAEADRDQQYVTEFCQKLGIPIFTKKVDVPYLSQKLAIGEEECGRRERYRFFEEIRKEIGGGIIATGHHMNDKAETVLFNLFRGSGVLRGIPCKRDDVIRPLINVTRKETEEYLSGNNIKWCEDSTNREDKYTRNKIRRIITVEIEKAFPKAVEKISNCETWARSDDEYLCYLARESGAFESGGIIKEKFLPLHESLQRRVVREALLFWGVDEVDKNHIDSVIDLIKGQNGNRLDIGNKITLVNNYSKVEIKKEKISFAEQTVKVGENLEITTFRGRWKLKTVDKSVKMRDNKIIVVLDADKMGKEVSVRTRRDGDFIYPLGMNGRKKLKDIFINLKIPRSERDEISLLCMGSEVLLIPKIRGTGNYLPDESTRKFFIAEYENF